MDERKAFEAWRRTPLQALAMTYGPKPHPDVEELAWRAWQAATAAERERAAKVCSEMVLVPKEPTPEMEDAAGESVYGYPRSKAAEWAKEEKFESAAYIGVEAYRAMIAAAIRGT